MSHPSDTHASEAPPSPSTQTDQTCSATTHEHAPAYPSLQTGVRKARSLSCRVNVSKASRAKHIIPLELRTLVHSHRVRPYREIPGGPVSAVTHAAASLSGPMIMVLCLEHPVCAHDRRGSGGMSGQTSGICRRFALPCKVREGGSGAYVSEFRGSEASCHAGHPDGRHGSVHTRRLRKKGKPKKRSVIGAKARHGAHKVKHSTHKHLHIAAHM